MYTDKTFAFPIELQMQRTHVLRLLNFNTILFPSNWERTEIEGQLKVTPDHRSKFPSLHKHFPPKLYPF